MTDKPEVLSGCAVRAEIQKESITSNQRLLDTELAVAIGHLENLRLNPAGLSTREAVVLLALQELRLWRQSCTGKHGSQAQCVSEPTCAVETRAEPEKCGGRCPRHGPYVLLGRQGPCPICEEIKQREASEVKASACPTCTRTGGVRPCGDSWHDHGQNGSPDSGKP